MATVIDVGLLNTFTPAFVFLLVLTLTYALLEKTEFFAKSNYINLTLALCLAVLFIVVPELVQVITIVTPLFVIFFLFLFLLILVFLFMGVKKDTIGGVFGETGKNQAVIWFVIIVSIIIFSVGFGQVFGEDVKQLTADEDLTEEDLNTEVADIIFTPKVMGLIFLMGITAFAARFISQSTGRLI
jgi:hypothetical protein